MFTITRLIVFLLIFLLSSCASQLQLGVNAYNHGQYDVAAKHWNKIAQNGNPIAQYNVGLLWMQGLGSTPLNMSNAADWFLLSAKQGYVPAMVNLALIQKDAGLNEFALSWLNLAARWGNNDAVTQLRNWQKPVPSPDLLHAKQYRDRIKLQNAMALSNALQQIGKTSGGGVIGNTSSYSSYPIQTNTNKYIGNLSANPYNPNSTSNPYGAGSKYNANSVNNPYGQYGSKYSPKSATNPYATNAPKLYDSQGNYRGKLSNNPYDPDSISNPYGRYGNSYSPDSVNNPYGAGTPFLPDSPTNPYGTGWKIIGE